MRLDFGGRGQFGQAVGLADGVADPQVAGGQHVGAAQGEDQEHVHGPDADALDLGEPLDDLGVGQRRQFLEDHGAVAGVARQVADVGGLLAGKAQRPHARRAQLEDALGRELAARRRPPGGRRSRWPRAR